MPISTTKKRPGDLALSPDVWATVLPDDRPRLTRVALWDPKAIGGLVDASSELIEVVLVDGNIHRVGAEILDMPDVIARFASLPRSAEVHDSLHAIALAVRFALDLSARGRLLPWITQDGYDSWRIGPIEPSDSGYLDRIIGAAHAAVYCAALDEAPDPDAAYRIESSVSVLTRLLDAVADSLVRSPAAALVSGNPAFADQHGLRIPHLRPWLTELVQPYAAGCRLMIGAVPPLEDDERITSDSPWWLEFSLRSAKDRSVIVSAEDLWREPAMATSVLGDDAESEFLMGLRQATLICPVLGSAMEEAAPSGLAIRPEDIPAFLDSIGDLAKAGIEVRWPGQSENATVDQRARVSATAPAGDLPPVLDLQSLLQVEWEVVINGQLLTQSELKELANAKRPVVRIRGQWVVLNDEQRRQLAEPPPMPSVPELLAASVAPRAKGTGDGELSFDIDTAATYRLRGAIAEASKAFGELRSPTPAVEPPGFAATLRDYQREGVGWLKSLASLGIGGVLADDMGLGKTVQILAFHAGIKGPTLVVCPTSVLTNWEREAAAFVPDAEVLRYHGPNRSLPEELTRNQIVLTTYGVIRSDAEALGDRTWNLVVADEAQAFKNPNSRTAKAMRLIDGNVRVALTGTPVENKLLELWSIISWALPDYLGSMAEFRRRFATPIERDDDDRARDMLQALISPIVLRRRKTDPGIAPELPDKVERNVVVPLTTEQITLYMAAADQGLEDLASSQDEISRQGMVLKMLTALKQITNHPANFLGESEPLAGRSGKLEELVDLLSVASDNGESTLIFTQYVQMGNLIVDHCTSQGFDIGFLHGSRTIKQRQEQVDAFQAGELPVLVLSLKAGGTGLNLTAASQVIHYDRWWNPAVEDQATDRAYRIGQDKMVTVHRLVTAGTVEDRIAAMLDQKRELAESVLAGGESWVANLSNDELAAMVRLDSPNVIGQSQEQF